MRRLRLDARLEQSANDLRLRVRRVLLAGADGVEECGAELEETGKLLSVLPGRLRLRVAEELEVGRQDALQSDTSSALRRSEHYVATALTSLTSLERNTSGKM